MVLHHRFLFESDIKNCICAQEHLLDGKIGISSAIPASCLENFCFST